MKNIMILLVALMTLSGAQQLHVDSVIVDSIWNSDSSWYDNSGLFVQRFSRDCRVSFIPQGTNEVGYEIRISFDGGLTWEFVCPSLDSIRGSYCNSIHVAYELSISPSGPCSVGQKRTEIIRVQEPDRDNVVFRVIANQYTLPIYPCLRTRYLGVVDSVVPGQEVEVDMAVAIDSSTAVSSIAAAPSKIYWDALGNGNYDDSTIGLSWKWRLAVPQGPSGQRRGLLARLLDVNGKLSAPETLTVQFGLKKPIQMVDVAGGTFDMGNDYAPASSPVHSVTLSDYKMSATETTQELYEAVVGTLPIRENYFRDLVFPVFDLTWFDAVLFCNGLSKLSGFDTVYSYKSANYTTNYGKKNCTSLSNISCDISKNGYRLPTEAEWEYACRADISEPWLDDPNPYVWHSGNSSLQINNNTYGTAPHPVAEKLPNAWGFYDLMGNVWEMCNDWYGGYSSSSQNNPTGPDSGQQKVRRGGAYTLAVYPQDNWLPQDDWLLASYRNKYPPDGFDESHGFRLVRK